jgi:ABC-type xylose transport system permease subunit
MNALTPTQVLAGLGVVLVVLFVWRAGARRARATARAARSSVRLVSLAGRVLINAALIVIVQWVVATHRGDGWLLLGVLVVPALFASYALTRALTVTTYEPRRRERR